MLYRHTDTEEHLRRIQLLEREIKFTHHSKYQIKVHTISKRPWKALMISKIQLFRGMQAWKTILTKIGKAIYSSATLMNKSLWRMSTNRHDLQRMRAHQVDKVTIANTKLKNRSLTKKMRMHIRILNIAKLISTWTFWMWKVIIQTITDLLLSQIKGTFPPIISVKILPVKTSFIHNPKY